MHRVDFTTGVYAGQRNVIRFFVTRPDGSPEPITGWAMEFEVRENPDGPAIVTKTTTSGITIISGAAGIVEVVTTSADTATLLPDRENYYMLRRSDSGSERAMAEGIIVFNSSMSR